MAHAYSTDSKERQLFPFFIALAAIGASFAIYKAMHAMNWEFPWWSPSVDTMVFYGLFYWLFDSFIWKWNWVHKTSITKVPDLSGQWRGVVTPAQAGTNGHLVQSTEIEVTIRQTWATMKISGRTLSSISHSVSAMLAVSDGAVLSYEYVNEPIATAVPTMHMHRGTAILRLNADGNQLAGDYYTGRDRGTIGTISLSRSIG